MEGLHAELNERAEAATSSYSAAVDFLQHIYSVLAAKNHQKTRRRCLVHEFFCTFFNDINHDYEAAILKKNYLCLLSFYMANGYLLLLWKYAQNDVHYNCIVPH